MDKKDVPSSLRIWFIIHFFADIIFAIPLILFSAWTLSFFGFNGDDTLIARFFGASLVAIGSTSLIVRNASLEVYDSMLTLKILFSGSAIVGIIISIIDGAPKSAWLFLIIFSIFFLIWSYYKRQLKLNKKLM